ncbi:uncharacterized protein K452DRAFT_250731 [Aplosporella prunicola CBS 121167]|uniref:2,5-diamino-6-ribosylamino-4(3H)-pyrimidinone 5'-phosphate reductase n=1 Tax=Aplosporella prunicola CBS 121167 TaxID=1176127 RepID=A0A6A6BEU6_9PEZI|nr:uncharacterized protein K452DRAFT_250731 [Aplosporella prunicola CBS 121167]KAF2141835.1 hypothetical protein K452DRAFT_250731 [Aplosporella prunicola CBS 121167]
MSEAAHVPKTRDALHVDAAAITALEPYLPPAAPTSSSNASTPTKPYTTLTFATSLDSALALAPGTQTLLSGPASKAMTHHLRSRHAAILVGAGTARVDDPSLNCRAEGVGGYGGEGLDGQPRPVVVDPSAGWDFGDDGDGDGEGKGKIAKVLKLALDGRGRAPWVVVREGTAVPPKRRALLERCGGRYFALPTENNEPGGRIAWKAILALLAREGISSVMVEGGAGVINALLEPSNAGLVDAVVVTLAPTWLGEGAVTVAPGIRRDEGGGRIPVARLRDVQWCPLGEDVVLCGRMR